MVDRLAGSRQERDIRFDETYLRLRPREKRIVSYCFAMVDRWGPEAGWMTFFGTCFEEQGWGDISYYRCLLGIESKVEMKKAMLRLFSEPGLRDGN